MQREKWSDDRSEIRRIVVPSVGVEPTLGRFERELLFLIARRTLRINCAYLLGQFAFNAGDGGSLDGFDEGSREGRFCPLFISWST